MVIKGQINNKLSFDRVSEKDFYFYFVNQLFKLARNRIHNNNDYSCFKPNINYLYKTLCKRNLQLFKNII